MIGGALWLLALAPPGAGAEPPARAGSVRQDLLPALTARRERAEAQDGAATAYFAGRAAFSEAFPDLVDAALGDADALHALQERLRQDGLQRAAERVAGDPAGAGAPDVLAWRRAVDATCDAEDRAGAQRLRLLLALERGLAAAPGLGDRSVGRRLAELSAAQAPGDGAAPPSDQALAASDEALALQRWRRAARDAMARPRDGELAELVRTALAEQPAPTDPVAGVAAQRVRGQQDRLVRVRPLLGSELAGAVDPWIAAADGALYGSAADEAPAAAPVGLRPLAQVESDLGRARAARAEAEAAIAELRADPATTDGRLRAAEARAGAVGREVAALERERETARVAEDAGLGATASRVGDADRLADEARRRSEAEAGTRRVADLRAEVAGVRSATADLVRSGAERHKAGVEELAAWRRRLEALREERRAAWELSVLDPERRGRLDAAYLAARGLCTDLQRALDGRRAGVTEAAAPGGPVVTALAQGDPAEVLGERQEALDAFAAERRAAVDGAVADQDALVRLLLEARRERRAARDTAGVEVRRVGQREFLPELAEEVSDLPLVAGAALRGAGRWGRGVGALATDLSALLSLVREFSVFLAAVLAWSVLRRLAPGAVQTLERGLGSGDSPRLVWLLDRLEPGDPALLPALLVPLATATLDVGFGGASFLAFRGVPVLSLLAWSAFAVAAWRLVPPAVVLGVSTPGRPHPSPWRGADADRRRGIGTLRAWLGWWLGFLGLDTVVLDILGADRVAQAVDVLFAGGTLALFVGTAWAWAPFVRRAVPPTFGGALGRFARGEGTAWLRVPRAWVGAVLVAAELGLRAARDAASTSERLGWLGSALARRDIEVSPSLAPLEAATTDRLARVGPGLPPASVEAERWVAELRERGECGLVAVVGRHEDAFGALVRTLSAGALVVADPPRRLTTEPEALAWVGEALGCPGLDERALVARLEALPRTTIVVADLHRALLRRVDGFAAVQVVLRVAQALAEEHLVVCCLDEELWRYFEGAPGVVDPAMFRARHPVRVTAGEELGQWLLAGLGAAGLRPVFPGSGGDEVRARRAYLRLLADSTQGRCELARRTWLATLRRGPEPDAVVHAAPPPAEVLAAGDDDLFLFAALAMHRSLTDAELAEVLNQDLGSVRSRCLRLGAGGWLAQRPETREWSVPAERFPAVILSLRRKALVVTP